MSLTTIDGPKTTLAPGTTGGASADCPAGATVVGTGFFVSIADIGFAEKFGTFVGIFAVNNTGISVDINAQAICATLPAGAAIRTRATSRSDATKAFAEKIAQFKADLR